jgi:molybdenum cofactor cytidylyltransferase
MAITREGVKGPIAVIVLAAGGARRFGGAKLLAPWRGGQLIDGALTTAFAAPAEEVLVAVGARTEATAAAARAFAERLGQGERLRIVEVADWAEGLSASLRTAVAALSPTTRAAFVLLADMPLIPPGLPARLAEALGDAHAAAAPTVEGELGHPVLLGAELFGQVATLTGDRGARRLLEALGPRLARVPVEDRNVLLDVDTPAALELATRAFAESCD